MNNAFELHPQLAADCFELGQFPLCRLLLMNESRYPWFILVPQRPELTEIHQLADDDQRRLIQESSVLARALERVFKADKLNIAAIGNVVPQLHLHHIARYRHDAAWPAPVWGKFQPLPYTDDARMQVADALTAALPPSFISFEKQ
ncbi:HIT domain-containing protein [Candidatus Methylospira mobilis]|uniref:HIT domain-containing protein n=1 Tax=Candidatus Methylospira mobilis TaxID=1808979 RepID=A0A5Q0BFK1_9GAMM|nr:HIT domain-containing protein [Candidatus Methylospira mobilis]QFY42309.1 HIT domain-containing protein [Candidatus Methylospira mobilis]WNV04577.1 HIT domain-containing protein [Candidatus Methylospira mobilis]